MSEKINIIIPAIKIDEELLSCLKEINKINYSNFFVTIVLDYDEYSYLPKFKYKIHKLIVGKINMSKKRNLAAKKFKSKYIAFIDSDAYPNKSWLKLAIKYLKQKKGDVVGGPSLPFSNQNYSEKICYLSKRSLFVTGYLNFRKYKAKSRLCDWLESCNLVMEKKFFLKYKGMDENRYTGEDKEFFERARRKNPNIKVFYTPDLYIHHRERRFFGFLLQRSCFGMDFLNLIKYDVGLRGFQPLLPLSVFLFILMIVFFNILFFTKITILVASLLLINSIIFLETKRYIKSLKDLILTILTINLANLAFALGSLLGLFGLQKILANKIYAYSRWNN
tara:strand:- start:733 stop:1737 length:1005 start_codon:yes stop_codon:yes gene_type:complete